MPKFIITEDRINDGEYEGWNFSSTDHEMTEEEKTQGFPFAMYDKNGTLCFRGRCIFNEDMEPEGYYMPLMMFGEYYDCKTIAYSGLAVDKPFFI